MTAPPAIDLGDAALFLDFDGVLVALAPRPDRVRLSAALPALLTALETQTDGALAIVTGRAVADLRRHLPTVPRIVVGSHGAEVDRGTGTVSPHPLAGAPEVRRLQERVAALAAQAPGLLAEMKPVGAVLHYRQAPDWDARVAAAMADIAADHPGFSLHPAKMAQELRPSDVGKDKAVAGLMAGAPFAGRQPAYFGDDDTDEPAMALVAGLGGIAVKVGEGPSVAAFRLAGPAQVQATLDRWRRQARRRHD